MNRTTASLPYARSYWVIPDLLLGGYYPGDRDPRVTRGKLHCLLHCGVTDIINLMPADEKDYAGRSFSDYETCFLDLAQLRRQEASWKRFPICDLSVPTVQQMSQTLDAIDSAIYRGGCVYVHCWGGRGRTGTVLACWLARHGSVDPLRELRTATRHAREYFVQVPETVVQHDFVRKWEVGV